MISGFEVDDPQTLSEPAALDQWSCTEYRWEFEMPDGSIFILKKFIYRYPITTPGMSSLYFYILLLYIINIHYYLA